MSLIKYRTPSLALLFFLPLLTPLSHGALCKAALITDTIAELKSPFQSTGGASLTIQQFFVMAERVTPKNPDINIERLQKNYISIPNIGSDRVKALLAIAESIDSNAFNIFKSSPSKTYDPEGSAILTLASIMSGKSMAELSRKNVNTLMPNTTSSALLTFADSMDLISSAELNSLYAKASLYGEHGALLVFASVMSEKSIEYIKNQYIPKIMRDVDFDALLITAILNPFAL